MTSHHDGMTSQANSPRLVGAIGPQAILDRFRKSLEHHQIDMVELSHAGRSGTAGAQVVVLDGSDQSMSQLEQYLGQSDLNGAPVLVRFTLEAAMPYRVARERLLAAGAADVIQTTADDDSFVTRVRGLFLLGRAPHILVVDDDIEIAAWAGSELATAGFAVSTVHSLAEARRRFEREPIDALVVDRQLPDGDGLNFVRQLRRQKIYTPALLYTAMTHIADRVEGLENGGAQDYLCKPVHADELRARVRVLLRPRQSEDLMIFGPLELSRKNRLVRWRGQRIDMRPRETDMLIYLAERADLSIPQQMLYMDIWEKVHMEPGSNPVSATKHRMLAGIRTFIEEQGDKLPDFIETDGNNYKFVVEPLLRLQDA